MNFLYKENGILSLVKNANHSICHSLPLGGENFLAFGCEVCLSGCLLNNFTMVEVKLYTLLQIFINLFLYGIQNLQPYLQTNHESLFIEM